MRPMIPNNPFYSLTIPELSGGINLRDGISLVRDNQLTAARNMWYKDGMLKTRPGFNTLKDFISKEKSVHGLPETGEIYANEKNFRIINGITYYLVAYYASRENFIDFYYFSPGAQKEYYYIGRIDNIPSDVKHCNIFQFQSDIYCFCDGFFPEEEIPFYIYKISSDKTGSDSQWEIARINHSDIYAPLLAHNGCLYHDSGNMREREILRGFDMLEGLNLLGNSYRIISSTVDLEELENKESHPMKYLLPLNITKTSTKQLIPGIFSVKLANKVNDKIIEHRVEATNSIDCYEEKTSSDIDGLRAIVKIKENGNVILTFEGHSSGIRELNKTDYMLNDMEITAPCENSEKNYKKVLGMSFSEWFGGGAEGLNGGIQLFMGGHSEEKNLVIWSDIKKPLYFSENAYTYAGDKSQKVTAFAKQGDRLYIFKEKEIFSTSYNSISSAMDAESVLNQSIFDTAASEVTFPMIQAHNSIGCDCPDTVQLCRNRLVWANSDGSVYTLVSGSQYSERNIFKISDMISRELKTISPQEFMNAKATDWLGYYTLAIGNKIFALDYNSYGFANISSYTKQEDAQLLAPWWIWDIPSEYKIRELVNMNDKLSALTLVLFDGRDDDRSCHTFLDILYFSEEQTEDILPIISGIDEIFDLDIYHYTYTRSIESKEIPSMLQTKFFDFGSPTTKKSIPKIEVAFGTNGAVPIKTTVITENTTEEDEIVINDEESEKFSPGYFRNRLIRLANKHACRVGIKFESEGNMSIDAISLQYKRLRGLK